MRILVVSDIHANLAALDAVREPFDVCLCLGDLVEYGPDPVACVAWVRANARYCVRGNHDHGVAHDVEVTGQSGFRYLTMATRRATGDQLPAADRRYLATLPTTQFVTLGGLRFMLVHACPRDPMDEYVAPDPVAWSQRLTGISVDFLLVGHTHTPFKLTCDRTTVVNPGSVGLQRDGNPLARYAVIEDGRVTLKQVSYDIPRVVAAVRASTLTPLAKTMLANVYERGRYVHPPELPTPGGNRGPGLTPPPMQPVAPAAAPNPAESEAVLLVPAPEPGR